MAGRVALPLATRAGFELIPRGRREAFSTDEYEVAPRDGYQVIPRGRQEPFSTDEYDIAPYGEYQRIPRGRIEAFRAEGYDVLPHGHYDFVKHDYYSPIPDLNTLPDDVWTGRSALAGMDLGLDRAIELVETELAPFVQEFDVPLHGPLDPGVFYLHSGNYGSVDAELLYAMIRSLRPRRLVELGSGFSTLVIDMACRRNAADGAPVDAASYDPYPRLDVLGAEPPPGIRFEAIPAAEIALDTFTSLEAGDILFVDTTHTVKLGSDVNLIVLDVLPQLAPGVVVHFHDIFLPWEYPRVWLEEMGLLLGRAVPAAGVPRPSTGTSRWCCPPTPWCATTSTGCAASSRR